MEKSIFIPSHMNGPATSGNGGIGAARLSAFLDAPVTVRISAPIPLDQPLSVTHSDQGVVAAFGEKLIMTAKPSGLRLTPPPAPSLEAAQAASQNPGSFGDSPDNTCFVCSRHRADGDGLCIKCGSSEKAEGVLSVWCPHENFCDPNGFAEEDVIWGALDCPGGFAVPIHGKPTLLGEITAQVLKRPEVGEPVIIQAWHDKSDGRKHWAGSVLRRPDGEILAQADTLWIELKAPLPKTRVIN